jgi:hypothetical protein
MKASFKCGVCGEKLTLTGTFAGIEQARIMWMKGHEHLPKNHTESVGIVRLGDQTITTGPLTFIDAPLDAAPERGEKGGDV